MCIFYICHMSYSEMGPIHQLGNRRQWGENPFG